MKRRGLFRPRLAFSAGPEAGNDAEVRAAEARAERFRQVMLPHMDAAYNLARYLTRDAAAAEDVVQEAFLRALRGFDAWRGDAAKPWLLAIVRNCFLSSVAGKMAPGRLQDVDALAGQLPPELVVEVTPESLLADRNEATMLRAVVEQLPEPFREALVLREFEELSYKEIAAIAKVPVGTVMSRLARARRMLAELLAADTHREARA